MSAVPAAGMPLAVVAVAALVALAVVLVVGAGGVRVIGQRAGQQRFDLCVRRAARAGIQRNARLGQPPPMPPQISVSTPCVLRNTASAPWPLPFVSTTSLEVILPFSTVYSLNCCVWPKCWNTSPFS